MVQDAVSLVQEAGIAVARAYWALLLPAVAFALLAVMVKRRGVIAATRRALPEVRTTLILIGVNAMLVVPLVALAATGLSAALREGGLYLVAPAVWESMPVPLVLLAAIFAGDFVGYWRHRLEHVAVLWPAHAVHHSDTRMTWLTLERFHPINLLTTALVDAVVLVALGFPVEALIVNNLVRHYYGFFIHADVPWTFGPLGRVLVSPAMHRWHHTAEEHAYGKNFATVFAVFDRWFGTWYVPGPCETELGVRELRGVDVAGQLLHPFRPSSYRQPGSRLLPGSSRRAPRT